MDRGRRDVSKGTEGRNDQGRKQQRNRTKVVHRKPAPKDRQQGQDRGRSPAPGVCQPSAQKEADRTDGASPQSQQYGPS